MAFPVVDATETGTSGGSGITSHPITLPSGSGGLILVIFSSNEDTDADTSSSGWTRLGTLAQGLNARGTLFSSTSGGALTVDTAVARQSSHVSARISGAGAVSVASASGSSSANPDPGSLTPAGGAQDYLWLLGLTVDASVAATNTVTEPTGFGTPVVQQPSSTNGALAALTTQNLNASTLNPSAFTLGTAEQWVCWTIAVAPAGGGGGGVPPSIDGSSPARVTFGSGISGTTATFDPPASVLVACVNIDNGSTGTATPSISNNGTALSWTQVVGNQGGVGHASAWLFVAILPSARTGMTVTCTLDNSESTSFKVYVVTGAHNSPVGASTSGNSTTNNLTTSGFTTQATQSLGFVVGTDFTFPGAPSSSDTTEDAFHSVAGDGICGLSGYKSLGGAASSAIFNLDASGTAAADWWWVSAEIKAAEVTAVVEGSRSTNRHPGRRPGPPLAPSPRFTPIDTPVAFPSGAGGVAVITGTAAAGKVVPRLGNDGSGGGSGSATARKIAQVVGACVASPAPTGVARRIAPVVGAGVVGIPAASSTATKVAPARGHGSVGGVSTFRGFTGRALAGAVTAAMVSTKRVAVAGACCAGAGLAGVARRTTPVTGAGALVGVVSTGIARRITPVTGVGALAGATSSGTARKLTAVAPARGVAGATSSSTSRKVAPERGHAVAGAAGVARKLIAGAGALGCATSSATARKVVVTGGACIAGGALVARTQRGHALAGAITRAAVSTKRVAVAGACCAGTGLAGTARHLGLIAGSGRAGATSSSTARKLTAVVPARGVVGATASSTARKLTAVTGAGVPAGATSSCTARRIAPERGHAVAGAVGGFRKLSTGHLLAGVITRATARKVVPVGGRVAAGLAGNGIARKVAPDRGAGCTGGFGATASRKVARPVGAVVVCVIPRCFLRIGLPVVAGTTITDVSTHYRSDIPAGVATERKAGTPESVY